MKNLNPKRYTPNSSKRGFSLIELIVTISIFIMITTVTMANYPKFSNKLSLDLLAQDIALSLRQAQIFGSSVVGSKADVTGRTRVFTAYGLHFESPPVPYPAKYTYLLFADITNTNQDITSGIKRYQGRSGFDEALACLEPTLADPSNPGQPSECLQKFQIAGRNKIKYLCKNVGDIVKADRVSACADPTNQISVLDIIFVRPNLDAKFTALDINGDIITGVSSAGIVLESPGGGYYKTVVIWKTGQISVE